MINDLLSPNKLSTIQNDVLIGSLLGDGSLSKDSKYPRLKIDRQLIDINYLSWQYLIFKDLCLSGIKQYSKYDRRYNKKYDYIYFRTKSSSILSEYYDKWYIDGAKSIPDDIELTPMVMAVWIADDGCVIKNNNSLTLKISTECFGELGVNILSNKLSTRYNEKFPIYRKYPGKNQFFIKVSTCAAQVVLKDIQQHILEIGMHRKYNIWKDFNLNIKPNIGRPKKMR